MAEETKNTKPADEEIEKTAEPTAGEEKQPEAEKAESDTAAAKEEQPEKKGFFGKKKEKKDKKVRIMLLGYVTPTAYHAKQPISKCDFCI